MKAILLITAMLLTSAAGLIAETSRRGGGGLVQRGAATQRSQSTRRSQFGPGTTNQFQQQRRQQLRSQVTNQQREQYRVGNQFMDRIRTQARDMERVSAGTFNADQVRQQRDQLRDQVRTMEQQNQHLIQGLNSEQRAAVEQRTRNMNQIQKRINSRLQNVDQELAKPSPNRERIAEQARYVERETQQYQRQYRNLGDDLSLRNDES